MDNCDSIWKAAQAQLKETLDEDSFGRYLANVIPLSFDAASGRLLLGVHNELLALWLTSNYTSIVHDSLRETGHEGVEVVFESGHGKEPAATVTRPVRKRVKPAHKTQKAPPYRPDYTFENFIVGNSARICYAAAQAVCSAPGHAYNPMFIYGGVGLGKTHLLQAIANEVSRHHKRAKVEYLTSEDFVNLYVEALRSKTLPEFRKHFRALDFLLIDDVQFFEGKVGSSEEFFHTFNTLHNARKQMVLASDRTPLELSGLEQRLVSRFNCGLSAEILPPDLETRVAILKKKQENQPMQLPDETLFLIASRIRSNIRNLESAVIKLIMNITAFGYESTMEQVEDLLRDKFDEPADRQLSVEAIQRCVADYYDIRLADMTSRKRPQNIAFPRMVAMYLSRKLTPMSLPAIGDAFNRNHATILHAVKSIGKRIENEDGLGDVVNTLTRQLQLP